MNPCRPFITRPVMTTLLSMALVIAGLFGYRALPVGDLPNISVPIIYVVATQPGASPQQMASSVTTPLERRLGQISGISSIESDSTDSTAFILLTFDDSRNIDGAANDVQAALRAAMQDMPATLDMVPQYWKANPADSPIMVMALTSDTRPIAELYDIMQTHLQPMLSQVKGVGWIQITGSSAPAVRVEMDPYPLFKYGIGFEDIRSALASANANTPKGFIDVGTQRYTLATNDQARHAAQYRDLVVGYRNGRPVRLADLAEVHDGVQDERQTGYFNNHRAVMAIVRPQPGANVIRVMDAIRARTPAMIAALPAGVTLTPAMDRSITIRASLGDTQLTLLISVLLVVAVVLVFLRAPRSTLIPAITVPISLAGTLAAMYLLGFSLDTLSLMALTIATGFVVDDAIVVVENIARHMEAGQSRADAAMRGAGEIAFTVLSITIALVAVFLPLLLMPGTPGKIFYEFAMTLAVTVTVSLFLSISLTPMMCGLLLDVAHGAPLPAGASALRRGLRRLSDGIEWTFEAVLRAYVRSLDHALRRRRLVLATLPLSLVVTVAVITVMPKDIIPKQDVAMIVGYFRGDETASFQKMDAKIRAVSAAMLADRDAESVAAFTGDTRVEGQAFAQMTGKRDRDDGPDEMIARVHKRLEATGLTGVRLSLFSAGDVNGGGGRQQQGAYRFVLRSDNAEDIYSWTPRITQALQGSKVMTDISTNLTDRATAVHVDIARDTAARYLVTPQLISGALFDAYGQRSASNISTPLATYHVVMEVAPRYRDSPDVLGAFRVSTSGGTAGGGTASNTVRVTLPPQPQGTDSSQAAALSQQSFRNAVANKLAGGVGASNGSAVSSSAETMVPLPVVARLARRPTSIMVSHRDGFVSGAISFNLAKGQSLDAAEAEIRATMVRLHVPATIEGGFTGQAEQFQTALINELLVFLAALATMYVTLGILYESYVHPITIMSTLPSATVGAVLALWATGQEFSLIAMIGMILLVGIVKKNAILMVDFALHAERDGAMSPEAAIREACARRFRPILMTTLAAAFGAIPLILSGGYGIELRRPLGIAVVGGLLMSQLLTLYTTPVVYLLLERIRSWTVRRVAGRWRGRTARAGGAAV
ncbi:efflux RND transporter permease subunit [Nguyenibacter vanlangensis]|uniref:Efflux RND transporter permease subunit n=2 Tax=Nguyenibacter vanlangensis TaxID=1216886 RepID=A0ABZ3D147_9PROT